MFRGEFVAEGRRWRLLPKSELISEGHMSQQTVFFEEICAKTLYNPPTEMRLEC